MIQLIKLLFGTALIAGSSGAAFIGSHQGWGLPGLLDEPVSVRQESVRRGRGVGVHYIYFATHRHSRGGYLGGK